MDERTLKALNGSIEKWEGIVAGSTHDMGVENCPLCKKFIHHECEGCPVRHKSGHRYCAATAYSKWKALGGMFNTAYAPSLKGAAQAELDFLRSLLPEGAK